MGVFDDISKLAKDNEDKIEAGIEAAGNFVDEKTGGKFADQVDQAQNFANDQLDKITGAEEQA